jgi:hypothetical protein
MSRATASESPAMHTTTRTIAAASILFTLAACSSDYRIVGAEPSTTAGASSLPQIRSSGGDVLKNPRVVPIIYPNDPLTQKIRGFFDKLPGSNYWGTLASNYGVGDITSGNAIMLDFAAPPLVDEDGVRSWFESNLDGSQPEFGAADPNAIYILFLPQMTAATYYGASLCNSPHLSGYHGDGIAGGGTRITYAVVARCADDIDTLTIEASHQLVDAAANPRPSIAPGFGAMDPDFLPWAQLPGAQVATMCESSSPASVFSSELGFAVHQVWSNAAAKAGKAPCFPSATGDVYFNSAPVLTEDVTMGSHTTKGLKLAVGETKTIDLHLFSDGDTGGSWTIDTVQNTESGAAELTFRVSPASGKNGDVVKLTMTRVQTGAADWGGTPFLLRSTLGSKQRFWPVFVAN